MQNISKKLVYGQRIGYNFLLKHDRPIVVYKNDRDDQEQQTEWSHEAQNNSYKKL